jgi:predicted HicB family RNase H-like nuclease
MNTLTIDGLKAVISFDEEARQFRGEFLGLNGGAEFYASSVDDLIQEGQASLRTFLSVCAENNIEPYRSFSGKFLVRIPETLHADAVHAASARGVSLNDLVRDAIMHEIGD